MAVLADGKPGQCWPGDQLITRTNNGTLRITATDWVKNGDRWTVSKVTCDRSLTVGHNRIGSAVRLRPLMSPSQSSWATPPLCALPRESRRYHARPGHQRRISAGLPHDDDPQPDANHLYLQVVGDG